MEKKVLTNTSKASLMNMLADKDGMVRQNARVELVKRGKSAVAPLIEALRNAKSDQVRWEAAKALGAVVDTESIPALVGALSDENSDVSWLAAEALKKFGKSAWSSLFHALVEGGRNSGSLYQGAHHVLVDQKEVGFNDLLAELLKDLEQGELSETAIVAAHEMLERMETKA